MSQTLQNQLINSKSMNGIIQLSDGIAVLENGSLTNVSNIDTDTLNTQSLTSNDFNVSTNLDLTSDTSKIQFTYNLDPTNTIIDRNGITTSSAFVKNLTFTNLSSNIAITNWDASSPVVSNGAISQQYLGSGTYTGTSGVITSGNGTNNYKFSVQRGQNFTYYTTYYPAGTAQCFVLDVTTNATITLKTINYTLTKGNYTFTFWVQTSTSVPLLFTSSVKTSPANIVLDQITGINVYDAFPNWIQFKMTFNLTQSSDIYFEWASNSTTHPNGSFMLLTGLVLTLSNAMIVTDTATNKTATISGSQSILYSTTINDGLDVTGGAVISGGLTTTSTYGSNNLGINTLMGSSVGASSSSNNVGIGASALQNITTATNVTAIGNGSLSLLSTGSNHIAVGKGSSILNNQSNSICIGVEQVVRGSNSVAIGRYTQLLTNQGTIGNFNVAIGTDALGSGRYNGFGVINNSEAVAIGYESQRLNADRYNTSIGYQTLYNLLGANGVTANGNNGFICQYNSSLGYRAGYNRNRYNNCTFIGSNSDASVENLFNATAIGYGCIVDLSNCIQLGSNGEKVKISGDLAGVTTINGIPFSTGGVNTLSQVLNAGNSAGTSNIDMNFNNITNINQLSIDKTTTGSGNPAINIICNNDDALPTDFSISRYSTTPAVNDQLFAMYISGRDSALNNLEYARINTEILDPNSTAPKGQMRFYTRGGTGLMGTYEILQLQDLEIDALRRINMNNNNIINGGTITGTTITGTSGSFTGQINMNNNNIINVNELRVNKTLSGVTNPAILLETNNVDGLPVNMVVNRYSTTPASTDELFTININGRDSGGNGVEYCRITSEILNVSSSVPQAELKFYCRDGTGTTNTFETLSMTHKLSTFQSGILNAFVNITANATINLSPTSIGSIVYIVSSTATQIINLPEITTNGSINNGGIMTITNLSSHQHTLTSTANIGGNYGSGATTLNINIGQSYLFTLQNSAWRCIQVFGVPYQYTRYHTLAQTGISTTNVTGLFNSACNSVDLNTSAWSLDTWNGTRLDYNSTTGVFTNNTGFTIVIQVQLRLHTPTTTTPRYAGIIKNATRQNDGATPAWYQLSQGGTSMIPVSDTFILKNTETFQVVYQAGASSTFGSTNSILHNRITITRIS